jgi:hypothetical protein
MDLRDTPCADCKAPVIQAVQLSGLPLVCEPDPVLTGTWRLTERVGLLPLASKPASKFAFGTKLYPTHVCARRWKKK